MRKSAEHEPKAVLLEGEIGYGAGDEDSGADDPDTVGLGGGWQYENPDEREARRRADIRAKRAAEDEELDSENKLAQDLVAEAQHKNACPYLTTRTVAGRQQNEH